MNTIIINGAQLRELIGTRQAFVTAGAFTLPIATEVLVRRAISICMNYSIQLVYELVDNNIFIQSSSKVKKRKATATHG